MPSKYGFGNTRQRNPYRMNKPAYGMDQKNPVMMDKPMKFNADLRKASAEGKLNPEFKAAVDAAPTKMYKDKPMKRYGKAHKMAHGDKPMKKYVSDAQRRAVHASRADGGAGNPNKMYGKKKK
jgi:hypothetical protein|tara:strand:- start:518 stop:886 length:369 start_codon:yes stop_codon:yes gene_type:complete